MVDLYRTIPYCTVTIHAGMGLQDIFISIHAGTGLQDIYIYARSIGSADMLVCMCMAYLMFHTGAGGGVRTRVYMALRCAHPPRGVPPNVATRAGLLGTRAKPCS